VVSSLVNVAYGPEQRADPALVPWKLEAARWADRLSALGVRRFHALSPYVAEVMGPRLGIPADRVDIIPRGRDAAALGAPSEARRARVRAALGVGPDEELVVAAARHEFQKGLDVLVGAWPAIRLAHPRARLAIAGRRGNQSNQLEAMIEGQGPGAAITWLGRRDDVGDLMVAADAFVVPSRWEGFGSILVEAMALGTSVVVSDVGPVPWVVGTGWARLVAPDDGEALAGAVGDALDQDPAERDRRARQGRDRFAQTFSLDVVADATVEFYGRALR
jgi:glycosyltransferase involved in cell wall biosynthesis